MRLLTLLLVPTALLPGQSRYARLGEFQGQVEVQLTAADPWMPAEHNLPLTQSAWLRTGPSGRLEIELDDGSAWRLGPDSLGEISDYTQLSTGQRITLLSLDRGVSYFTGEPKGKDVVMLVMPGAQATLSQGSRIRVDVEAAWSQIAVLEGQVLFSAPAAEMDIREGATARVEPATPSRFFLYPEVTAGALDRWSEDRDKVQTAPASGTHVTARYGLADLDAAGQWLSTNDLGLVWKPNVAQGWAPYQNGRWRYFESLGYTWVSDDSWGWLPYHNGRWAHKGNLGWVWQPAVSAIFRPGEVYWLRGSNFTGWGPLAPGERWTPPGLGAVVPQFFAAGNTTYAAFQPDIRTVDPAGFPEPSAEQLKTAAFVPALPSPTFLISRLDATRPVLKVGATRLTPSVTGVTFGDPPAPEPGPEAETSAVNDPPPPAAVADADPGASPPPDGAYTLPVAAVVAIGVPVAIRPPAHPEPAPAVAATANPPKPNPPPARPGGNRPVHEHPPATGTTASAGAPMAAGEHEHPPATGLTASSGAPMAAGELEIYRRVLQDVDPAAPNFVKALADLNAWTRTFPTSASQNDRLYYYIHVYNGMGRAGEVLDTAAPLVAAGVGNGYRDQQQALQILVAASASLQSVPKPTARQWATGQSAARQLLDFLPVYFSPGSKPANVGDAAWSQARAQLETVARQALARKPVPFSAAN